jgi:rRNA maturation endonuclease Nob1
MYLVNCKQCRTEFANEARICPRCGHLRNHVSLSTDAERYKTWPGAEAGVSTWRLAKSR